MGSFGRGDPWSDSIGQPGTNYTGYITLNKLNIALMFSVYPKQIKRSHTSTTPPSVFEVVLRDSQHAAVPL